MKPKIRAFSAFALILTLAAMFGAVPAFAVDDGAYLTSTYTYYLNPDSGETDDGGSQNAAIGEGMCRSVVDKTALAEYDNGKIYLTIRLLLMSNMQDIRLFAQSRPGGSYKSVSPKIIAEDAGADSADYRFEVSSLTGYVSWEMYVIPMGRDVKFYMNVSSSLTEGGGDFIVSVKPSKSTPTPAPTPTATVAPTATAAPTPSPTIAPTVNPTATPEPEVTPEPTDEPTPETTITPESSPTAEATQSPSPSPTAAATAEPGVSPSPSAPLETAATATVEPGATPDVSTAPAPTSTPSPELTPTPEVTPDAPAETEAPDSNSGVSSAAVTLIIIAAAVIIVIIIAVIIVRKKAGKRK
jgi:hypothetical protein